jgi:exodeoxyribonuclease-3
MKIATWNVNSLRVRLPQVLDWLASQSPDVLCLQETKVSDEQFPAAELRAAGYFAVCRGQKTYNGVAILSRGPPADAVGALPGADGEQKRFLAVTVGAVRVASVYVPNGESVSSDKYRYKLDWLERLRDYVADELRAHPNLVLAGDYNIAPEERDVHDPRLWAGQVLFSDPERAAFRRLLDAGLTDAFRRFDQPDQSFTWWDYRQGAFKRNRGLRIDHILLSPALAARLCACAIDPAPRALERPSDHAPVMIELDLGG